MTSPLLHAKIPVLQEPNVYYNSKIFRYKLPDGLALRSANVTADDIELGFEASPRVPTLEDEDIATAFRLASEKKRPEFFYIDFPPGHPFRGYRNFHLFSPTWLRWTKVGKLLADADWNMKCLDVGARSNEERTVFKSWPASSNLKGLRTHWDFENTSDAKVGTIKMYCDYATVLKGENEIVFPEEPKMKIVRTVNKHYSTYITENLPKVAYHDEPRFLKMQELIKLILTAEWLYNEKKVRMDPTWIMLHTSPAMEDADLVSGFPKREYPPEEMIPTPLPDFEPPDTDASVSTNNSELCKALRNETKLNLRFGYKDYLGAKTVIFTEEGDLYNVKDCLKARYTFESSDFSMGMFLFIPFNEVFQSEYIMNEMIESELMKNASYTSEKKSDISDSSPNTSRTTTTTCLEATPSNMKKEEDIFTTSEWDQFQNSIFHHADDGATDKMPASFDEILKPLLEIWKRIIVEQLKNLMMKAFNLEVPSITCSIENLSDEKEFNMLMNLTYSVKEPSSTAVLECKATWRYTTNDLDFMMGDKNPNEAVRAAIPAISKAAIIPGVTSWHELFTELTSPIPQYWQCPYTGSGQPTALGGICTQNFEVRSSLLSDIASVGVAAATALTSIAAPFSFQSSTSPKKEKKIQSSSYMETLVKDNPFKEDGKEKCTTMGNNSNKTHKKSSGKIKVKSMNYTGNKSDQSKRKQKPRIYTREHEYTVPVKRADCLNKVTFKRVEDPILSQKFLKCWIRGSLPTIKCIFAIENEVLNIKWKKYRGALMESEKVYTSEEYFYGTRLTCNIVKTGKVCTYENCGVCRIACDGMNPKQGETFCLADHSSYCDENSLQNREGYKAILLCDVLPGHKKDKTKTGQEFVIPDGFDSITGVVGTDLRYPLIVVKNYQAILPKYIVVFK